MTLVQRIAEINEQSKAWMDAAPGRWAGMLCTDPEHWWEYGIYTAEELDEYLDDCYEREVGESQRNAA